MKGRKLTIEEAIKKYAESKPLYYNDRLWQSYEVKDLGLTRFIEADWYEYKPEKKKNLLERFADWCDVELTYDSGYIYTNIIRTLDSDDVITWLEKQPESRLKQQEGEK